MFLQMLSTEKTLASLWECGLGGTRITMGHPTSPRHVPLYWRKSFHWIFFLWITAPGSLLLKIGGAGVLPLGRHYFVKLVRDHFCSTFQKSNYWGNFWKLNSYLKLLRKLDHETHVENCWKIAGDAEYVMRKWLTISLSNPSRLPRPNVSL